MQKNNKKDIKQCVIPVVSSSTVIEPISCELSDNMKSYMENMKWVNDNFHKHVTKVLMIPKEMFGK